MKIPANLNSMRVFETAARLGSFKLAAEQLHLTPTAVSHQIRKLETELGVALFERRVRAVALTDSGRQLADAARLALRTLDSAVEEIAASQSLLTVNTTSSFAAIWLVPRLAAFHRLHPDIRIRLQSDEQPISLKRQSAVDVAIRYGFQPEDQNAELLMTEKFGLFGTQSVLRDFSEGRPVTVYETEWKNPHLRQIAAQQWLAEFAPRTAAVQSHSFDQELHVIQAAIAGDGLAFVSDLLAEGAVRRHWLEPYRPEWQLPGFGYYLLIRSGEGRTVPAKVTRFRDWLMRELAET
ncbi:LysR family transcriptional regulator [Marinobacterium sp. CAU 1594]|nr:LysR family transcriptional regulator [Marinobacterium arenosum]